MIHIWFSYLQVILTNINHYYSMDDYTAATSEEASKLMQCIITADVQGVKYILEQEQEDVNQRDSHDNTALQRAAIALAVNSRIHCSKGVSIDWNSVPEVQILKLLAAVADPNQICGNDCLPGHTVVTLNVLGEVSEEILEKLVTVQNKDIASNFGFTMLHKAVESNNWEAVQFLLKKGASVNVKSTSGATPLSLALTSKAVLYDKLPLLISKENINFKNVQGCSALDYSLCGRRRIDAARMLLRHGAEVNVDTSMGSTSLDLLCSGVDACEHMDLLLQLMPARVPALPSNKVLYRALFSHIETFYERENDQFLMDKLIQCLLCHVFHSTEFRCIRLKINDVHGRGHFVSKSSTQYFSIQMDDQLLQQVSFFKAWAICYILCEFDCRAESAFIHYPVESELPEDLSKSDRHFAKQIQSLWEKQVAAMSSPLSLLQICCFAIRNSLSHNPPSIYSQLPVPCQLQDILSCKNIITVLHH